MQYVWFSLFFMLIHTVSYFTAGVVALKISKDIYEGKSRLMDYHRDMKNEEESLHVKKWFFPAQLLRGLLMSLVLYPLLPILGEIAFTGRFAFFFGLMFMYTHLTSAAPCPDNIEGAVYLKSRFFKASSFFKFQFEMVFYSSLFGAGAGLLLF